MRTLMFSTKWIFKVNKGFEKFYFEMKNFRVAKFVYEKFILDGFSIGVFEM